MAEQKMDMLNWVLPSLAAGAVGASAATFVMHGLGAIPIIIGVTASIVVSMATRIGVREAIRGVAKEIMPGEATKKEPPARQQTLEVPAAPSFENPEASHGLPPAARKPASEKLSVAD